MKGSVSSIGWSQPHEAEAAHIIIDHARARRELEHHVIMRREPSMLVERIIARCACLDHHPPLIPR